MALEEYPWGLGEGGPLLTIGEEKLGGGERKKYFKKGEGVGASSSLIMPRRRTIRGNQLYHLRELEELLLFKRSSKERRDR